MKKCWPNLLLLLRRRHILSHSFPTQHNRQQRNHHQKPFYKNRKTKAGKQKGMRSKSNGTGTESSVDETQLADRDRRQSPSV